MKARIAIALLCAGALLSGAGKPKVAATADWPAYGRDPGGSRYSPLAQIHRENVKQLKVAWTYRHGDVADGSETPEKSAFEATPIVVDGTLYFSTPFNRVIALDPETGAERWTYDPKINGAVPYGDGLISRGVSTWLDRRRSAPAPCRRRIFEATNDARLIALDAATGKPCEDFGQRGQVELGRDVGPFRPGEYHMTSPPAVIGDLVIVGSAISDNQRVDAPSGVVRALDARSGALRWSWDPLVRAGGVRAGAANAWSIISADAERDLVFVPTGSPSPDFYGGERPGSNLYANSVVALRASTGKPVWHFQVVHHDIWDYDVPAPPALITVRRNGKEIPAVAVVTKVGHVFVLDRETGKPLFPVEERPVPQGAVEGEKPWPTQPFPTLPRPLVPHKLSAEDAWGLTPADRAACRKRIEALRSEGIFTPVSLQGTILFPGNLGGMNWSGMAFDPERGLLVTNTNRLATIVRLIPREKFGAERGARLGVEMSAQTGAPYGMLRDWLLTPARLPCNPPPWGTLVAVDLNTGAVRWEVPLGALPQLAEVPGSSEWGSLNVGGAIVTAGGLVFIAAAMDNCLRAFDVETGKELWKGKLPAGGQATPMTYCIRKDGKQYVVIAAGGHGRLGTTLGDSLVAFALP